MKFNPNKARNIQILVPTLYTMLTREDIKMALISVIKLAFIKL